jgi:NADH-quinone oxidoreductase subunit J
MGLTTNIWMFVLFSATIIVFSFITIFSRRILRAAVSLLFVLVATSGFYFMMDYQFMAGVQLALYAGGIVVLIIFSILLTSKIHEKFDKPNILYLVLGGFTALAGCGISIYSVWNYAFTPSTELSMQVNMKQIGMQLLSTGMNGYALPFEVISILLLAAMIAAIVIAKKMI